MPSDSTALGTVCFCFLFASRFCAPLERVCLLVQRAGVVLVSGIRSFRSSVLTYFTYFSCTKREFSGLVLCLFLGSALFARLCLLTLLTFLVLISLTFLVLKGIRSFRSSWGLASALRSYAYVTYFSRTDFTCFTCVEGIRCSR
jgi:hypothetical protein